MPSTRSKNIIITGGARGIGRATTRHLLAQPAGHRVFIVDFDVEETKYAVEKHLAAFAPRANYGIANLRSVEEIRAVVAKAAEWFGGRIDVLINNAGVARGFFNAGNGTMEDIATTEQWYQYLDTNLSAPFFMSQAVIPFMKSKNTQKEAIDRNQDLKRTDEFRQLPQNLHGEDRFDEGGAIINIASFRAHQSDPDCEGYAASKGGLLGLNQAMSIPCQRWGIRVMAISPGWVSVQHECRARDEAAAAELNGHANGEANGHVTNEDKLFASRMRGWASDLEEIHHRQHPAGRVGRGEDLAELVEHVMNNGFLSGQEIILDGGANRRKNPDV